MRKIIKKKEIDVPIYKTEVRKIQVGTKKEKQKVYVAEDGTEFDSFKNCKKYEIDSFKKFIDSLPHVESFISPYDYSYSPCLTGGWHWYYFKTYEEFENFVLHKIYKESQVDAILEEAKTFNFPDWINFVEDDSGGYGPYYEIYSFKEEEQEFLNLKKALFDVMAL